MSEKLCVFCKDWYFDGGDTGYSEYTPGYNASMGCYKDRWKKGTKSISIMNIYSQEEFRKIILQAQTCPDYEQVNV
jgi:hypothetical protein